jgi:hypothetical protein
MRGEALFKHEAEPTKMERTDQASVVFAWVFSVSAREPVQPPR